MRHLLSGLSRGFCLLALASCAPGPRSDFVARDPVPDPDEARFVTEDIPRFWAAYDDASNKSEAEFAAEKAKLLGA